MNAFINVTVKTSYQLSDNITERDNMNNYILLSYRGYILMIINEILKQKIEY